jgi:hypothetical protein
MSTRITPTFLLKGVSPKILLKRYAEKNFPKKEKTPITITQFPSIAVNTCGNSTKDGNYYIKDKYNSKIFVATSGSGNIEVVQKTGEAPVKGGVCKSCLNTFEHESIGYPVAYQEYTLLMRDDETNPEVKPVYRIFHKFWIEGIFCCYECVLYHIELLQKAGTTLHRTTCDSIKLLKLMFRLTYPKAGPLKGTKDPLLLKRCGGSLEQKEWEDTRHTYHRTHKIILDYAKVSYNRQEQKSIVAYEASL